VHTLYVGLMIGGRHRQSVASTYRDNGRGHDDAAHLSAVIESGEHGRAHGHLHSDESLS